MIADGIVGIMQRARGALGTLRLSLTGALVTLDAHARFQEAVQNGQVFTIQAKTITVTAVTDISPLPATTGRAGVALYNPLSSGVNLTLWKLLIAHVSGTPGGPAYLDVISPDAACTDLNKVNAINNLTLQAGGHKAKAYAGNVPQNTKAGVMLKPVVGSTPAVVLGIPPLVEDLLDGSIIIPPGGAVALTWHAAGTTHIYSASLTWEETPFSPS